MANTIHPIEKFILEDLPELHHLALDASLEDKTINEKERRLLDFMAAFAGKMADYNDRRVFAHGVEHNGFSRQTRQYAKACGVELTVLKREPARIIKFPTRRNELDAS